MDKVLEIWEWLKLNHVNMIIVITTFIAFLEALVRLTPTKTDDGAIKRIGSVVDWICKMLKIPNVSGIQTFEKMKKDEAGK